MPQESTLGLWTLHCIQTLNLEWLSGCFLLFTEVSLTTSRAWWCSSPTSFFQEESLLTFATTSCKMVDSEISLARTQRYNKRQRKWDIFHHFLFRLSHKYLRVRRMSSSSWRMETIAHWTSTQSKLTSNCSKSRRKETLELTPLQWSATQRELIS